MLTVAPLPSRQFPLLVWAMWNYLKVHHVKSMLTPQLGSISVANAATETSTTSSTMPTSMATAATSDDEDDGRLYRLLPPRSAPS